MYTSIITHANKLSEVNVAVYSTDGTILPFAQAKQQIIKFIEYIDLNDIIKCYNDLTEDDINELFLLQEIIGRKNHISKYYKAKIIF